MRSADGPMNIAFFSVATGIGALAFVLHGLFRKSAFGIVVLSIASFPPSSSAWAISTRSRRSTGSGPAEPPVLEGTSGYGVSDPIFAHAFSGDHNPPLRSASTTACALLCTAEFAEDVLDVRADRSGPDPEPGPICGLSPSASCPSSTSASRGVRVAFSPAAARDRAADTRAASRLVGGVRLDDVIVRS